MMEETNGFATGYAVGRDSSNGGYGNNGLFGNDWAWIVILLLFGWGGNRGFGGYGGSYGGGVADNYVLATDFATIERKLDSVNSGICDSTYALNNTINANFRTLDNAISTIGYQALENTNAIQSQLASGFCGVQGAIKDVAYGNERNSWTISKQISDCCCDLEKMNLQNRFDAQAYNSNTLTAIDKLGDRIIDYMSNEKVQALRDENFALRLSASQAKQNEYLISRLGDKCPEPAYIVQPPQQVTFPTNCCGQVNYAGYNGGCGYSGNF
jgi:hypothetical protein